MRNDKKVKYGKGIAFLSKIIWNSSKSRFFWMGFISLISLIPQFVSIYGLKLIVDLIDRNANIKEIISNISFLVILEIIYYIFNSLYNKYIIPKSDIKIRKYVNDKIFTKLSQIDIQCYDNKEFYDTYTLGAKEADKTVIEYFSSLQMLVSNVLSFIFIVIIMSTIDPLLLLVPILGVICSLSFQFGIGKLVYKYSNEKNKKERYVEYIKRIFYTPSYAKEMIVLPICSLIFREYDNVNEQIKDVNKKYSSKICILDIFSNIIFSILGFGLILGTIAWRIVVCQHSIGDFVALANASLAAINSFIGVVNMFPRIMQHKLFALNILNLLNYRNIVQSSSSCKRFSDDYTIEFKHVDFSYPFTLNQITISDVMQLLAEMILDL